MAKDPAFLFYSNDFSIGTQFMNDDQVGKYVRLLLAQHQHGHLTEKQVLFICKSYDFDIISKFKKDAENCYFNERLEIEINRRKAYSESRGKNKKGKNKATDKDLPKQNPLKSYDNHMETENEIENKDIINKKGVKNKKIDKKPEIDLSEFPPEFISIWNMWKTYKKEKHKFTFLNAESEKRAIQELLNLAKNNLEKCEAIINQSIDSGWKGLFEIKQTEISKKNEYIKNTASELEQLLNARGHN